MKKKKKIEETEEERRARQHREHLEGLQTNNLSCMMLVFGLALYVALAIYFGWPLP